MSIYDRLAGAKKAEQRSYFGGTGTAHVAIVSITEGLSRKTRGPYLVFRAKVLDIVNEDPSRPISVRPGQEAGCYYDLSGTSDRSERDLERAKAAFLACLGLDESDVDADGHILDAEGVATDATIQGAMETLGANNGANAAGIEVYLDLQEVDKKSGTGTFTTSSWRPLD